MCHYCTLILGYGLCLHLAIFLPIFYLTKGKEIRDSRYCKKEGWGNKTVKKKDGLVQEFKTGKKIPYKKETSWEMSAESNHVVLYECLKTLSLWSDFF